MIILAVIISISIIILVHELGHFLTAKFFGVKVEEFGLGFPPQLFKKKVGETVYSINALPFGGFVKIFGEDGGSETSSFGEERSSGQRFADKPIWKRSAIMLAGVLMNVLLGWFVFSVVFTVGSPEHLMIAEVAPGSPAEAAGLLGGDVVLEIQHEGGRLQDPVKSNEFVDVVGRSSDNSFALTIMRGKEIFDFTLGGRLDPPEGQGSLGVSLVDVGSPPQPFFGSIVKGFETTISTLALVTVGFFNFFTRLFVSPGVIETVAGPIGIFVIASQAGALGIVYLLQLMAFISVNLAILNLIPFPALDGGRFVLLIIEKIKGSPIPKRFQIAVNTVGFMILIVLMILVTIQDVGRLIN